MKLFCGGRGVLFTHARRKTLHRHTCVPFAEGVCTCASKFAYNVLRNTHQHVARHFLFHANTIQTKCFGMPRLARMAPKSLVPKAGSFFCLHAYLLTLSQTCSMNCVNGDTRRRSYSIRDRFARVGINNLSHLSVGAYPLSTCLGLGFAVGEPTTCQHNLSPTFISGVLGFSASFTKV